MYPKFLIRNTDRFVPFDFPQLENSLQLLSEQLASQEPAPAADMILSFVKEQRIDSQHVKDHPRLAHLISTNSLSLQVMTDLFESSKMNENFRNELEDYIRSQLDGVNEKAKNIGSDKYDNEPK